MMDRSPEIGLLLFVGIAVGGAMFVGTVSWFVWNVMYLRRCTTCQARAVEEVAAMQPAREPKGRSTWAPVSVACFRCMSCGAEFSKPLGGPMIARPAGSSRARIGLPEVRAVRVGRARS
jgi:hypothetical protein